MPAVTHNHSTITKQPQRLPKQPHSPQCFTTTKIQTFTTSICVTTNKALTQQRLKYKLSAYTTTCTHSVCHPQAVLENGILHLLRHPLSCWLVSLLSAFPLPSTLVCECLLSPPRLHQILQNSSFFVINFLCVCVTVRCRNAQTRRLRDPPARTRRGDKKPNTGKPMRGLKRSSRRPVRVVDESFTR